MFPAKGNRAKTDLKKKEIVCFFIIIQVVKKKIINKKSTTTRALNACDYSVTFRSGVCVFCVLAH